jgi:hypothetical protein
VTLATFGLSLGMLAAFEGGVSGFQWSSGPRG